MGWDGEDRIVGFEMEMGKMEAKKSKKIMRMMMIMMMVMDEKQPKQQTKRAPRCAPTPIHVHADAVPSNCKRQTPFPSRSCGGRKQNERHILMLM
jgi:hypothetical protein